MSTDYCLYLYFGYKYIKGQQYLCVCCPITLNNGIKSIKGCQHGYVHHHHRLTVISYLEVSLIILFFSACCCYFVRVICYLLLDLIKCLAYIGDKIQKCSFKCFRCHYSFIGWKYIESMEPS